MAERWQDEERYGRGYESRRGDYGNRYEDDDYERGRYDEPRSRRGFASMDPEEHREISREGGRMSHGGQGRDWNDEYDRERRSFREEGEGGRSRRGFASMDPEEQREIASMGGRASHGGRSREDDDDDRYRSRSSSTGRSRRGFAAMDPEEQREIARMGGRASHEYGRGHEFTPEEAREAGRKGGQARWR